MQQLLNLHLLIGTLLMEVYVMSEFEHCFVEVVDRSTGSIYLVSFQSQVLFIDSLTIIHKIISFKCTRLILEITNSEVSSAINYSTIN